MLSFFKLFMNVAIIWSNEAVLIPIGESLENYKYLPEASLYVDDKLVNDRLMYYEYEINYTSFSVIRTHVIGTYTVWYRVHFPTLGFESDTAVTFNVYDNIKPLITGEKDIHVDVGTKTLDYKTLVSYSDNYNNTKDLIFNIYSAQVNLNQIGMYQVTYSVKDQGHNETVWIQNIHVVDSVNPVVKQKNQVILKLGEALDIDKFFTFSDNYDSVLDVTMYDSAVDYKKPGVYPVQLQVCDQSGNTSTLNISVTIQDTAAPKIVLKTAQLKINYKGQISQAELRALIIAVEDNMDILSTEDVLITSYIDTSYLGKYEVIYKITDSSNLTGEAKLIIEVVDQKAPTVTLLKDIVVDVHTLEPYIFDYLLIEDNYNLLEDLTITKTGTITMSKIGAYRIIVKVVDAAKNTTEFPVIVNVVDIVAPTLDMPLEHIIINFSKPDYLSMLSLFDNYDKEVYITIDDKDVDYSKIGTHDVRITASDSSDNETSKIMRIIIKDVSMPEIILKTHQAYIAYGTKDIDYLSYVETVFDTYDKDLKIIDILVSSTLNIKKVGLYQVVYEIKDASGNVGHAILYVYLNDYEKPTIEADHMTIKVGDHFDYKKYVRAVDNYDGDISYLVKMNPSFIPLNQPGYYEVLFYVHDTSGNYAETKVLLTVEALNDVMDYIYFIFGGLILIGGVIIYFVYVKKREKL